jgi:hypothetical protein
LFATRRGDSQAGGLQAPGGAFELAVDTPADDVPQAFVGGDTISMRRDDAHCQVARGDRVLADLPCGDAPGLVCADAHAPCAVTRGAQGARTFAWIDLDTGAIAPPFYTDSTPPTGRAPIPALSPDGATLAIAHFLPTVDLVDTRTGAKRTLAPGNPLRIQCLGWMPDGSSLLATDAQEAIISVGRLALDGVYTPIVSSPVRWYGDPRVSKDGKQLAVLTNDLTATYWLFEGYRGG